MMRETVLHYVERDGDREVHIIPNGGIFDVYFVKGKNCSRLYAFGLSNYKLCKNKYYDLDYVFQIAWKNFSTYEEMCEDE